MASKSSSHAAFNSVSERRLRPIYDLLNNGNNKKALQEADKVLKKQGDSQCCKALKSLALLRMGRETEAEALLDSVLHETPTEEGTLQAMANAFRELQQLEKICLMYEAAAARDPNNEEFLSHLFMSYVRMGFYKKQQVAAMSLYKAKQKNPYYFWAIMSLLLNATLGHDDDHLALSVTLPLAQRMISKMEKENKMNQEQETQLYLMVLEAQSKFKEALDVLDGPLGKKLNEQTSHLHLVSTKKIEYFKKLENWRSVNQFTKELLMKCPDQWCTYLDYITSAFHCFSEKTDDISEETLDNFLIDQSQKYPNDRGPYLARIEFLSRRMTKENCVTILPSLLSDYVLRFGAKETCFSDIKSYLTLLNESELVATFESVEKSINLKDGVPTTIHDISRHLCLLKMRHYVTTTDEDTLPLLHTYTSLRPLMKPYPPSELQPANTYVVLASHLFWNSWNKTKNNIYFWKSIVCLHSALSHSPTDYHLRFILIKFYNQIGAVGVSKEIHSGLFLKYIQLDSLGYLLSRHIQTCCHFKSASKIFGNTLRFFSGNYKDIADHIISAYRCGSFDKIVEFIKLRDRLSYSQHYKMLTVERILLDILMETSTHSQTVQMMSYLEIDPTTDSISWNDLVDNRDFKVMHSFDPPHKSLSEDYLLKNFYAEQRFLRLRSYVKRSLAAAIYISEDISSFRKSSFYSRSFNEYSTVISDLIHKLTSQTEKEESEHKDDTFNCLQGPNRPRINSYLKHCRFFISCLKLVSLCTTSTHSLAMTEKIDLSSSITQNFESLLSIVLTTLYSMFDRDQQFEELFNIVESASFFCVLMGVAVALHKSSGCSKKGRRKKEMEGRDEQTLVLLHQLMTNMETSLKTLMKFVINLEENIHPKDQDISDICIQFKMEEDSSIIKNIKASYSKTTHELKTVITNKLNYLNFLKLSC